MEMPVLLEPIPERGFRASGGFELSAEGATRDEALMKLADLVRRRLAAGAEVVSFELPGGEHPWAEFAGVYQNDTEFDAWQAAIESRRQEIENDPDAP